MKRRRHRWDFFHLTESKSNNVRVYSFMIPEGVSIGDGLRIAKSKGLPKGTHSKGCFEIQNERGIFSHRNGKRIDVSTERRRQNIDFIPWE